MFVLNATATMRFRLVLFVPRGAIQTNQPCLPSRLKLPTPVLIDRLVLLLDGYIPSTVDFLRQGFTEGFSIHFQGSLAEIPSKNLASAFQHPEIIDASLCKELSAGRIAGPFSNPPFRNFRISPLGLVPKKASGEFRLIHHLSYPKGLSINEGIPDEFSTVSYATIDDAIRSIKKAGRGCFLAKTDIKSAFRIIPINPKDYHLLGMQWDGKFYYDKCMPMGCSSSCRTFETLSTAVEWIARHRLKIDYIIHLLDDFLLMANTFKICSQQLELFVTVCTYLGIPIAPEKTVGPSNVLSFAGIELDTIEMEARLPPDKISKCIWLISEFMHKKKVTLKEIQSLLGFLNFACSIVKPGRAFLRRLIDLTIGVRSPHHLIRLNKSVKADLQLWLSFLSQYNGRTFFVDEHWLNSDKLNLFTDASGALGFGAICNTHWCYGRWPAEWAYMNIAILEFYPIVLSLYLWGHEMGNKSIVFYTDNEALVHVINKQSCKDKQLMTFVRRLVLICLQHNIVFRARHIAGSRNRLADSLSRLQVQTFQQLAPSSMDSLPTDIPLHLQPQNWQL